MKRVPPPLRSDAAPDDLPAVLRDPPWVRRAPKAKAASEKIGGKQVARPRKAATLAEAVVLSDEVPRPGAPRIKGTLGDPKAVLRLEGQRARGEIVSLRELADLSDGAASDVFVRFPFTFWSNHWLGRDLVVQLARFGVPAIEPCLRFAEKWPAEVCVALEAAVSPRVAPLMARVLVRLKRARPVAERWLVRHPRVAAMGLLTEPADQRDVDAALRFLAARGFADAVRDVAREQGCPERLDGLLDAPTPELLGAPLEAPALPTWCDPAGFPRPRLARSQRELSLEAVTRLLEMLAFSDPNEPYVGIAQVKDACDPDSLGDFAWEVAVAWSEADYPAKDKWALLAVGYFGRDRHAERLAPLVRSWPTDNAFARAVLGLDVLATMKSDVALTLLHGISTKAKSSALKKRAHEKFAEAFAAQGLGVEDGADRVVPTLGLGLDGTRTLSLGPREFRVGFDAHRRPFVEASSDRGRLRDLPKPAKGDDPIEAAKALALWGEIKKASRALLPQQVARLEQGMIAERRWTPDAFATFIRHPILRLASAGLVFGVWVGRRLRATFRVAEDGTYADVDEAVLTVSEGSSIGVVHPLHLDARTSARWGEVLYDYAIVQPFLQLGRDVAKRAPAALTPVEDVDPRRLLGLSSRGWRRGPVDDGGIVTTFDWECGAIRAELRLCPGLPIGEPTSLPQTIEDVLFVGDNGAEVVPSPIFLAEVAAVLDSVRRGP